MFLFLLYGAIVLEPYIILVSQGYFNLWIIIYISLYLKLFLSFATGSITPARLNLNTPMYIMPTLQLPSYNS
jgi:hypothetical protein